MENRHPCICPVCMGWISEHIDPLLKKEGWFKCRSCGYSEKREEPPYENLVTQGKDNPRS